MVCVNTSTWALNSPHSIHNLLYERGQNNFSRINHFLLILRQKKTGGDNCRPLLFTETVPEGAAYNQFTRSAGRM